MDYTAVNKEIVFKGEEISEDIEIKLAADDVFPETNKTFEVYLSASPGVFISPPGYVSATILNDDPELTGTVSCTVYIFHIIYILFVVVNISFGVPSVSVSEGKGFVELTLTKTHGAEGPVSVTLHTVDGTAG